MQSKKQSIFFLHEFFFFFLCTGGEGGEEEDSDETDDDDVNAEPTQAYHFDGAAAEGEEQKEEAEPMDCDATVAYRIEGKQDSLFTENLRFV